MVHLANELEPHQATRYTSALIAYILSRLHDIGGKETEQYKQGNYISNVISDI